MRFDIITIFPEMFKGALDHSIIGKAKERNLIEVNLHNLRDWTQDKHHITDDYTYGGGAGMLMKVEPFARAVASLKKETPNSKVLLMTPQGTLFSHGMAKELSTAGTAGTSGFIILCGRYEGVDERVRGLADMEISVGDYVLTGGELPAMTLIDAVSRLIPSVLGKENSAKHDSHSENLLEYPQYTRPPEYEGMTVPDVLLSGDHAKIEKWRREMSIIRTAERRPDLLKKAGLTVGEWSLAKKISEEKDES